MPNFEFYFGFCRNYLEKSIRVDEIKHIIMKNDYYLFLYFS